MKHFISTLLFCFVAVSAIYAQTETAQKLYKEAIADRSKLSQFLGQDFSAIDSTSMHDLGVMFYIDNDYRSAGACWEIALQKVKKYGKAYEKILNKLSVVYNKLDDVKKTEWLMGVIEEFNVEEMKKKCADYKCCTEHAQYYLYHGDEANAKANIIEALKLCESEEQRIEVEEAFARMLFDIQDYESCAQYYRSAYKRRMSVGGDMEGLGIDMYMAAQNYMLVSKYKVAEECAREAVEYFKTQQNDTARKYYLMSLNSLGDALYLQERYSDALETYSLEIKEYSVWMPNTEKHAAALDDMAKVEEKMKQYDNAEKHYRAALDIYKNVGQDNKYSETYSKLTVCLRKAGKDDKADQMEEESENRRKEVYQRLLDSELPSLEITRKYLGSLVYTNSLNTVASCYFGVGNYAESANYYGLYVQNLRDMLRERFVMMTENDRQRLWKEQQGHIDDFRYQIAALPDTANYSLQSFIPTMYDIELLSKGIMLNSSIEFEKVLNSMKDKSLVKLYEEVKENYRKIDELQSSASEENLQKTIALKRENALLEQKLMKGCREVRDYTEYLSYTWRDVQKRLGEGDIAVEFTTVQLTPLDKYTYLLALILKKTGEPVMEVISNRVLIKNMERREDLYDNPEFYQLFWGFMQKHLEGVNRVFFASDNMLSNIAIEYLKDGDRPFFETHEVYRLSSTKELCRSYDKVANNQLYIFGDIDYNAEVASDTRDAVSFGRLAHSREEVDGIAESVKGKYKTKIYDGKKATEAAFISMSEKCPSVLHISSHGAFNGDGKTSAEEAMSNSVLALAGANVPNLPSNNDGVISAADIANMNLRACDLAVLSACQTGIGGLGDDGVFGLQRGFKNAGVRSLLMSLKSVYDEATTKLMVAFYEGLAKGLTKREALVEAQKKLRAKAEFKEGRYWAPFILLDAFERE